MDGVDPTSPWWSRNRRLPAVLLGVLAVGFAAMALAQAWSDAPTFDEPVYVAAGLVAVTHHDLWMNDEHPPLAKVVAALPAMMVQPIVPRAATRSIADDRAYSAQFVHANLTAGRLRRVIFLARLVPIAESIGVAAACWVLAGGVAGPWAGLVAGGLWLASPTSLGLGHLDGIDLPFTLVTVLLAIAVDRYLRSPSRWRAATVGGGAALALGVRNTGLLVAPIAVAVVALLGARVRGRRDALADAALAAVLAWVGLWAVYLLLDPSQISHIGVAPAPFLSGLHRLRQIGTLPDWAFVLGRYHHGIWPWYWPHILLVKEPIPTVAVMFGGLFSWRWLAADDRRRLAASCVAPGAVLALFAVLQPRPIGLRYFLPVIPLWLVAASPIALASRHRTGGGTGPDPPARRRDVGSIRVAALGLTVAVGVAAVAVSAPNSISWTEPPFRPGWQVATNSDVDWGQGFWDLVAWSPAHHPWVAYFGPRGLVATDVPGAQSLPAGSRPRVGWIAVSASLVTAAPSGAYTWLRAFCPVGTLGGSILLYHFAPAGPASPGSAAPSVDGNSLVPVAVVKTPSTPAGLCRTTSSR